jgi:hypothetical protein
MKKTIGMLTAVTAIFALFLVNISVAQDTPPTYVNGGVRLEGLKTFGNDIIGGFSYLNSGAGFSILPGGDCHRQETAEGIAAARGTLNAGGNVSENSLSLNSLARTITEATQLKGKSGEVYIDGLAERANWGTLKIGDSFISGWDSSQALYYGTASGPSPSILGKAVTSGTMELSITPNSTTGKITDDSLALVRGTPGTADPAVQGSAGLASGTHVSGPDFTAAAQTDTRAAYSATDPKKAAGGLEIDSSTQVTQNPDGSVSLKATTGAKAFTKTGPTAPVKK